jgi:uncharacterized protein (TIGR00251 family)
MSQGWCCTVPDGIRVTVQVMPNAKKSEVVGVIDDALKIRLHAQPIEGKANDALVRFLADALGIPKSTVSILRGHTSKRKIVAIAACGHTLDSVKHLLAPAGN